MWKKIVVSTTTRQRTIGRSSSRGIGQWRHFSTRHQNQPVEPSSPEQIRRQTPNLDLDNKKGRGWSDLWDMEAAFQSKQELDDLPDWSPDLVSRISRERVQVLPSLPTMDQLAQLALPSPPPTHPVVNAKVYALQRQRYLYRTVSEQVAALAAPQVADIQKLTSWEEKQDAVDQLFESIEMELKEQNSILGKHPKFGSWVERALEEYLKSLQNEDNQRDTINNTDNTALPVFMDCYNPDDGDAVVPTILRPLALNNRGMNQGRLIEEWNLAANKVTKRILLRQCIRNIARALQASTQARVLVTGGPGAGKTATLAAMVVAARTAGHVVLYLPDGYHLHVHGYYVEPNERRPGIFDSPVLCQQVCGQFLASHENDVADIPVEETTLLEMMTSDQRGKLPESGITVADLLRIAVDKENLAAGCYSAAIRTLMNQDKVPFIMVLDEFNCYYGPGEYYHGDYDPQVRKPIPYDKISLFQPFLEAMGLSNDPEHPAEPVGFMSKGAIIAGTSESRGVARLVTDSLIRAARAVPKDSAIPMTVCDVPRLSKVEVEHVLANYECIGLGNLRLDQGSTVLNENEVEYLRVVSGAIPQKLMDACIW